MVTQQPKFYPPPRPTTPREAPWRETEEIIELLKQLILAINNLSFEGGAITVNAIVPHKRSFHTDQRDVTTAGEPEQLQDYLVPDGYPITVIAKPGNSGTIYVAPQDSIITKPFNGLDPGLATSLKVKNANCIWVDAETDGDGVSWHVECD